MASEYEKVRDGNIARNNAFLQELGINPNNSKKQRSPRVAATRKRKRHQKIYDTKLVRRSTRNAPQSDLLAGIDDDDKDDSEGEDEDSRRNVTAASLRKFIDAANAQHGAIISDQAIVHVVSRLKSMSVKALSSRIRAIARAAGQHSKEKLLVTMYAMKVSSLTELAASCEEALARLEEERQRHQ